MNNLYSVPPFKFSEIEAFINKNRPSDFKYNGKYRSKKEIVYNKIFSKAREFLKESVVYCGLTSVFPDRIFKIGYPIFHKMECFEKDDFNLIDLFINSTIKESGLFEFVRMSTHKGDILDLELHNGNYGIIDLDFCCTSDILKCRKINELIEKCADEKTIVMVWNMYGRKITKKGHIRLMDSLKNMLNKKFSIRYRGRNIYKESSPMCCEYFFIERRKEKNEEEN